VDRKLASIRKISSVKPIDGADNIEVIMIDGWQLVTQKSNNFKPGDLVVYFEIDSFLPIKPEFEFLRKSSYRNTENLGEGFRIKTIKLKGQVSQGLALPLTEFAQYSTHDCNWYLPFPNDIDYIVEGYDLTEYLKVQKYEAPIPACLVEKIKGNFPSFIPKTDSERAQNLLDDIWDKYRDEPFQVTQKLDGSSMTVYRKDDYFGVCSRNLDLLEDDVNSFWMVANKLNLKEKLNDVYNRGYEIAIKGELVGPGIEKNKEKLTELEFYVFNVYDIKLQKYLTPEQAKMIADGLGLKFVPVVYTGVLGKCDSKEEFMNMLTVMSKGPMMNGEGKREGLVFKHLNSDFNFKVINPEFLLKYDE
jgi:RNA ligase (TIGR02306 family)